ncbi:nanos homolog 1 [Protopterus annectens]|uniref:nanos homolog 1 n=1 Tax=Protopterus annectens TaxID=7888 RepID=UPI001CFB4F87|nr:nanos homolog 1 [Protopterus annectens]
MMETFQSMENQSVNYLQSAEYTPGDYDSAFNSWNDYLGLATLITKVISSKTGFGHQSDSRKALIPSRASCFETSLGLQDLDFCTSRTVVVGERCTDFSPFPGVSCCSCSSDSVERERCAATAWEVKECKTPNHQQHNFHKLPRSKPDVQICVFCRNNKEAVSLYTTHILKGPDGRVLCPVLRRYTCPLCGANGDNAHTIKYCPLSKLQPGITAKHLKIVRNIHLGKKVR